MSFFAVTGLNTISCLVMVGVIWVIQVVHYPSFNYVNKSNFSAFEKFHSFRISIIVIPFMFLELITSIAMCFLATEAYLYPSIFLLFLTLSVWASTFYFSAPLHVQLLKSYNENLIHKLVSTNWPRTCIWSFRATLLIFLLGNYNHG